MDKKQPTNPFGIDLSSDDDDDNNVNNVQIQSDKKQLISNNTNELIDEPLITNPTASTSQSIDNNQNNELPTFSVRRRRKQNPHESLDYDICENDLWTEEENTRDSFAARKDFMRWIVFILIGICVALIASFVDMSVEEISKLKYSFIKKSIDNNIFEIHGDIVIPYIFYGLINMTLVAFGSYLVTYIEPVAGGSGVPLVKSYLNGIKVPRIVRIKTLFVKVFGVILAVSGSLVGGKEGPMIHAGSVVAAGISQGKSTTFRRDFRIFEYFRDDHEKRDFVVGGAAAGVAAAFGAPLGGVLFALEEGASFWNQSLIWKAMVSSIISSFTLNVILSAYHNLKTFSYPGLFNLGQFEPLPFELVEIPIFVLMGIFGGLTGALWNMVNTKMAIFRTKYLPKWGKMLEAILMAGITATIAFVMIYFINDCRSQDLQPTSYPIQLFCKENEYNVIASLWFETPEASVKALFHDPKGSYELMSLVYFVLIYYPLSCFTFGLSVSLGLFIPSLLVGAAWGRITAILLSMIFPAWTTIHPSKYALIGAAAQLGGIVRMTISLTVILIETTGNISFALPLLITLISAKWMGDYFNEGIYDIQIKVSNLPMLEWHTRKDKQKLKAHHIMADVPICIGTKTKVRTVLNILNNCSHNGFPVIENVNPLGTTGQVKGLILRHQLIVIIKNRFFIETERFNKSEITLRKFRQEYPRYPSIKDIKIDKEKLHFTIDLEKFMNRTPYTITEDWSVPRVFQTFRALGLRHVIVVDKSHNARGMITRKDFL